jgi:hypothetical protein
MTFKRGILTSVLGVTAMGALIAGSSVATPHAAPAMRQAAWYRCAVGLAPENGVRVEGNYGQLTSVYFISHSLFPGHVHVKELRYGRQYGATVLPGHTIRFDFNVFGYEPIYRIFLIDSSTAGPDPTFNVDSTRCH